MSRKPPRRDTPVKLSMTPMIDVVFLLLVFFLLVMKQEDILSQLDARRPALPAIGDPPPPLNQIDIRIDAAGYSIYDRQMDPATLRSFLAQQADLVPDQPVIIHCADNASHGDLVRALDICAAEKLNRIAIASERRPRAH